MGEIKKHKFIYYHCTYSKGRHKEIGYIPEVKMAELFEDSVKAVHLPQDRVDWIKDAFRNHNARGVNSAERGLKSLETELNRANQRLSRLYDAKFDGTIEPEDFEAKEKEYKEAIANFKSQIQKCERVNPNYFEDGARILELSNRLYPIYVKATFNDKARILKVLASNYTIRQEDNVTICPTYRKPFDLLAKGLLHSKWLPEDDAYQTFIEDEFAFEISTIAKGHKRFILQEPSNFCKEYA